MRSPVWRDTWTRSRYVIADRHEHYQVRIREPHQRYGVVTVLGIDAKKATRRSPTISLQLII